MRDIKSAGYNAEEDLTGPEEPVAWIWEYLIEGVWVEILKKDRPRDTPRRRNIEPLFKRAAPAAPRIGAGEEEIARGVLISRGISKRFTDVQKEAATDAWVSALRDARAILDALRDPSAVAALLTGPRAGGETR